MTTAEVRLWGRRVGAVSWLPDRELGAFEYDPAFLAAPVEIAPATMPKSGANIWTFPNLPRATFHGLPGMLADVLPDKFGRSLLDQWLTRQGRDPARVNPVERLCFLGQRGMGALTFHPFHESIPESPGSLAIPELVQLANQALRQRGLLDEQLTSESVASIIRVGTSAGGARAKAVIAWNPTTNEVRSGQADGLPKGFEHWLCKFDGITGNADKEAADPQGFGRVEYAYHLMALAAGIDMSPCRLFEEGGRAHFMTKRFDRIGATGRLHMQSLCAIGHHDFNHAGGTSYEQALTTCKQLGCGRADMRELFRRMVFNIFAYNRDDHTKNIAFLMDKQGSWRLSPAFDVTYAHNPDGAWTSRHQMSCNGKRELFAVDDLVTVARAFRIHDAEGVVEDVRQAVLAWPDYATQANTPANLRNVIEATIESGLGAFTSP